MKNYGIKKLAMTECICPKCRKQHEIRMRWVGRGVPRIYCDSCKHLVGGIYDLLYGNGTKTNFSKSPQI